MPPTPVPEPAPQPVDESIWRRPSADAGAPATHRTVVVDTAPVPAPTRRTVPLREVIGLGPRRPLAGWVRRLGSVTGVLATFGVVLAAALIVRSVAFPEENEVADAVWITEPTRLEPVPTTVAADPAPATTVAPAAGTTVVDTIVPGSAGGAASGSPGVLGAGSAGSAPVPTTAARPNGSSAPATTAAGSSAPAPTAAPTPSGSSGGSTLSPPTTAAPAPVTPPTPPTPPTTAAPAPPSPTTTPSTVPSTTAAPPSSSPVTASAVGGSVRAVCSGPTAVVQSVSPNPGFDAEQNQSGGDRIDVRFRSDSHDSRIRISCDADGTPSASVTEEGDATPG